jgi:pilus assembly protein CpaC
LIQENKARVLSEPSLLVLDGAQASMLVGGEFPIPVANGFGAITIVFKPFGIRLNVAPTLVSDDTIQMTVTPEVSALDFADAVTFNGGSVPSITVRRATSTLQLKDGSTFVIGGLYSSNYSNDVQKIPYLSNIPVLGEFFKNSTKQKIESELLVMIEAEIVNPDTAGVKPPPPGSLENMNIPKPFVPRKEFDQDFPDLQNFPHQTDPETPTAPVSLPPTTPDSAGK